VQIKQPDICRNSLKVSHFSVGIAVGYGLDGQGSIPGRVKRFLFFSSLQHPDWLLGILSLLSNGYQDYFSRGKVAGV
jgi:hypothetical protein